MKYLFFAFIIPLLSSCTKNPDECPDDFFIPALISPQGDTYGLGDTITITSIFDKFVFDKNTEKKYNMQSIKWNPIIHIHKLDTNVVDPNNLQIAMHKYVDFIPDEKYNLHYFHFSDGGSTLDGNYQLKSDTFTYEVKLIPKRKGTYFLTLGLELINSQQEFEGKCKHVGFDAHAIINENKDNNIDFLKESPNTHYNDWILQKPEERFYNGGFCFKVE